MQIFNRFRSSMSSLVQDFQSVNAECQRFQGNQEQEMKLAGKVAAVATKSLAALAVSMSAFLVLKAVFAASLPMMAAGLVGGVIAHDLAVVAHNHLHPDVETGLRMGGQRVFRFFGGQEASPVDHLRARCSKTIVFDHLLDGVEGLVNWVSPAKA